MKEKNAQKEENVQGFVSFLYYIPLCSFVLNSRKKKKEKNYLQFFKRAQL